MLIVALNVLNNSYIYILFICHICEICERNQNKILSTKHQQQSSKKKFIKTKV